MLLKTLPWKIIKWHIFGWTLFIASEVALAAGINSTGGIPDYVVHYVLYVSLFYLHAHVILPAAFGIRKSYIKLALLILTEFAGLVAAKYAILCAFAYLNIPLSPPFANNKDYIVTGLFRAVFFLGLSTGYWFAITTLTNKRQIDHLNSNRLINRLESERLENKLLTTENAYIKAQVNPHFLLNTLTFLYNSVAKFNEDIAESVMSLSEIMRYALADSDADGTVPLQSEIDHIENLIKLNQARFNQRLHINFSIGGKPDQKKIIPLVLITIVENIFKYGNLADASNPATIYLFAGNDELVFKTENLKKTKVLAERHGIGLANVRNRLSQFYDYELLIDENESRHQLALKIKLEEKS
jgi:hypothetical protein